MRAALQRLWQGRPALGGGLFGLFVCGLLVAWGVGLVGAGGEAYEGEEVPPCEPEPDLVKAPSRPEPEQGAWRREPDSPLGRDEAATAVVGGRIYMVGGHRRIEGVVNPWERWSTDRGVVFDPRRRAFAELPRMPSPVDHAAAASYGGDLYVVGGWSNGRPSGRFLRYSPARRRWTELPPMRQARGALQAAVVGGRLYAVGGSAPTLPDPDVEPHHTVEVFDFRSRRWSRAPDMPVARHHHGMEAMDGRLYVVGGRERHNYQLTSVERFDPATGRWERMPGLPQGVSGPAVASTGDELIVAGGGDDRERFVTPAVWALDPDRRRWRRLPNMNVARHAAVGGVVGSRMWVFEGAPCPGYGGTRSAESLALG